MAKEVSIYESYLKETEASFRALAASTEYIERIFAFKVSYHTRILQNEVAEELAHLLSRQANPASKAQTNCENEPSSPASRAQAIPHSRQDFSTPRK
jgi:hypothetical protein